PRSPVFPYTTLFRSGLAQRQRHHAVLEVGVGLGRADLPVAVLGEGDLAGGELLEGDGLVPGDRLLREVALLDPAAHPGEAGGERDRKSTRLNSSHVS